LEDFIQNQETQPNGGDDETQPGQTEPEETEPVQIGPIIDFVGLKEINEECVGWIYIEDTRINYPVMQGKDNDYYLNHLINKKWNGGGSIFMDYRVNADMSERHCILYGHRLKNGNMFHGLTKYKKQSYYEAHPTGYFVTPEQTYLIEFFSAYVVSAEEDAWRLQFASDEEYEAWLKKAKDRSYFKSSVSPTAADKVLTMSTCTYEIDDARLVLVGILRPV
jgi:sortase B